MSRVPSMSATTVCFSLPIEEHLVTVGNVEKAMLCNPPSNQYFRLVGLVARFLFCGCIYMYTFGGIVWGCETSLVWYE